MLYSHSYGTWLPNLRLYPFFGKWGGAGRIPDFVFQCFVDRRLFQRNNPEFQNEDDIFFKIQFTVTKLKTQTLNLLSEQSSEKL